jgi:hypothetical protein
MDASMDEAPRRTSEMISALTRRAGQGTVAGEGFEPS